MIKAVAGIDPGLKGSMAVVKSDGSLVIERLPLLKEQRATRVVTQIDTTKLASILTSHGVTSVLVEDVFSMPRDSRRGAFTFGGVKAAIVAAARQAGCSLSYVGPSVWKARMRVTKDKKSSRKLAERLFPTTRFKSTDDCEAALLVAYYLLVYTAPSDAADNSSGSK